VRRAREADSPQAASQRRAIEAAAQHWLAMSYEQLWALPVGSRLPRSWQVWSNGQCPTCRGDGRGYDWIIAPRERPWQVTCPHCAGVFPTNDFEAYYRSGIDHAGEFDPTGADRSLLRRTDASAGDSDQDADASFGIDDGEGF